MDRLEERRQDENGRDQLENKNQYEKTAKMIVVVSCTILMLVPVLLKEVICSL